MGTNQPWYWRFSSVQFSRSVVSNSLRPHGLQYTQASLSINNSRNLYKLMYIESVIPSNHLILSHSLLFSHQGLFKWVSSLHKYWSFSFSISPSNEYSGLISFWIDWFELLAVQDTLKSLCQHHSLKASALQHSIFFVRRNSHFCTRLWKNHSFDYWELCRQSDASAF